MAAKTLERERYDLIRRNQATMAQVDTLLEREANKVLSLAEQFGQQQMGGYLRTVVPGLLDRYGNVNAVAAMKYYDEQRMLAFERTKLKDYRRGSQREAAAKLKAQIYVARMAPVDSKALAEPIIGTGMKALMADGFGEMRQAVNNAMTRAVASYNRDTILYNAGLDSAVITVQRVAEPTACAFCALMAFSSQRSASGDALDVRTTSYAVDFHNNCHCSIETLYEGDEPIRPDYYDQFEQEYLDNYKGNGVKDTLAEWRGNTGRS